MDERDWRNYFEDNATDWIKGAYDDGKYTYPVGYHRLRILKKVIKRYNLKDKKVLDIGCGGGDISFYMASKGAFVDGIDMSSSMLKIVTERRDSLPKEEQERLSFHQMEFHDIPAKMGNKKYDCIVAFGLIGYLESDAAFFEIISSVCHLGTVLLVSCRNRLFNISSVTNNTITEIEEGYATKLIEEIDTYYQEDIPIEKIIHFIDNIKVVARKIDAKKMVKHMEPSEKDKKTFHGADRMLARQSTPVSFSRDASHNGFIVKHFFGVHPHLLLPRLNIKLPPTLFNLLSDVLCAFEEEKISLIWSSVFIAELVKQK